MKCGISCWGFFLGGGGWWEREGVRYVQIGCIDFAEVLYIFLVSQERNFKIVSFYVSY